MKQRKIAKILLVQIFLLFTLGLWTLFQKGLPNLEQTAMFDILPQLFPLIISALFLFLLPLFQPKQKFIFWTIIILSFSLMILNASQLFQTEYHIAIFPLSLLVIFNLFFGVFYSIKLRSI
jgi:hypothetical protein